MQTDGEMALPIIPWWPHHRSLFMFLSCEAQKAVRPLRFDPSEDLGTCKGHQCIHEGILLSDIKAALARMTPDEREQECHSRD